MITGLPGEHIQYLEADHRHICKFKSPNDVNYVILQRCLLNTLQEIERNGKMNFYKQMDQTSFSYRTEKFSRNDEHKSQMKRVSEILKIRSRPETDLLSVTEKQHKGSCDWVTKSENFQEWLDIRCDYEPDSLDEITNVGPRFLWLNGPPGSGKSVSSGHVIRFLESCNFDCSFFFFDHRDKGGSSLSEMLRSLAFQMASLNREVRTILLEMADNDMSLLLEDHNILWNTVFKNHIFNIEFSQPQFWVIDALDECSSKGLGTLVQMLAKIDVKLPLRIFFTSRPGGQVEKLFSQHNTKILELETGSQESLSDIAIFVREKWTYSEDPIVSKRLVAEVLKKSNGIFLWASLIINRLNEAYSLEDMEDILQQVPSEMNEFYMRIVQSIAESQGAELAKCILKWTICAARPLSTDELREAVHVDIGRTLTTSDDKLSLVCGHLITVDKDNCVQVIHQTVAAFLTQERSSFWIDKPASHSRLAEICLGHLNGKNFAPPRSRRMASTRGTKTAFSDYACTYFSYHLSHCSSVIDAPLVLIDSFFETNCLTWIERVAETGTLSTLTRTVQNLRAYLARREKYRSPLGKEVQQVRYWIDDISHIVTAFGLNLLDSPSSIHFLIPPLCPPASAIHQLFVKPSRQFKLIGSSEETWDDRISSFLYPTDVLSVATNMQLLAIGLANGTVKLYDNITFELIATLTHGEPVRLMTFGTLTSILATCSPRKVLLWSHRQIPLWSSSLEAIPLAMCFSSNDDELWIPKRDGVITVFNISDGTKADETPLNCSSDSDSDEGNQTARGIPPSIVRLSSAHKLAAIAYRNSPVTIWDMDRANRVGVFEKEGSEDIYTSPQVIDMVFNPVPELDLMAIAYKDGDIVTCDPWTLEQHSIYGILVHVLVASPDGRTLATGDTEGVVHLFAFETLRLIYRVAAIDDYVMSIVFASNSLRFFDIRGTSCNVWEPSALIRRESSDDASSEPQSEEIVAAVPAMVVTRSFEEDEAITVVEHSLETDFVFCGRENGTISIHDLNTGNVVKEFRFHARMVGIRHMKWNAKHSILVSVDSSSRCLATRLTRPTNGEWQQVKRLFEHRTGKAISQVLIAPDGSTILLSISGVSELWNIEQGLIASTNTTTLTTWITHPTKEEQLIQLQGNTLRVFEWSRLRETSMDGGILLANPFSLNTLTGGTWLSHKGHNTMAWIGRLEGQEVGFMTLEGAKVDANAVQIEVSFVRNRLYAYMKLPIGLVRSSLFFLDTRGWVCSIGVKAIHNVKFYTRHFFIPLTWQTASELAIKAISKSSIAFAHQDQLKIFHGFLDFEEKVYLAK